MANRWNKFFVTFTPQAYIADIRCIKASLSQNAGC